VAEEKKKLDATGRTVDGAEDNGMLTIRPVFAGGILVTSGTLWAGGCLGTGAVTADRVQVLGAATGGSCQHNGT
jgi:hypothetical protein